MSLAPGSSSPAIPARTNGPTRPRRRPPIRTEPEAEGRRRGTAIASAVGWMLGVTILALAWLVPGTAASAVLGWAAALLIVHALRSGRAYLAAYGAGVIGYLIAFYWVHGTVIAFGGFSPPAAALVFALFAALGGVQFLAIAVIDRHLHTVFDALALRSATAVVLAELITPRLFPWHFGHTQLAFTPFVQVAGIAGAMAVSFLLFWTAEVAVRVLIFRERRRGFLVPLAVLGLAMAYGVAMIGRFGAPGAVQQEVVVAQGHAGAREKRDLQRAREYLARLFDLSRRAAHPGSLVVWPEGAIPAYIPAILGTVGEPAILPWVGDGSAYLVGGYSFLPDDRRFNTAFAVYPDGEVPLPYFKRVLIPFGESMPLASWFPALKSLNARAGVFTPGTEARVFDYPMHRPDGVAYNLKVSPLICYEDTMPALAREATRKGAELLVNISSDAWFGRTLAPHQHHVIAAFRAIENRRYLVRSTTTGLSAVVDPLGRTIASIAPFTEGTATVTVNLLNDASAYTQWVGDRPWWSLLAISLGLALLARRDRKAGAAIA